LGFRVEGVALADGARVAEEGVQVCEAPEALRLFWGLGFRVRGLGFGI
jgi:hypothetical protein